MLLLRPTLAVLLDDMLQLYKNVCSVPILFWLYPAGRFLNKRGDLRSLAFIFDC